jgi:DNA repair photolyase
MAVLEIQAKTLLASVHQPDKTFGLKYNMNLYRGCQHQCIYCDSRSACYEIENFNHDVLIKANALELLERELPRKRVKGVIGTGSMNDPYMPLEARMDLTGRALDIIARYGFGAHIITKSDLVLRDLDRLAAVSRSYVCVTFSISTCDDDLARKLEPGAPPPSARLAAMRTLAALGIHTGVSMMPVLPFLTDSEDTIAGIVEAAADAGGGYIIPWFGMSLRDRQRTYYYHKLDQLFPGLRARYQAVFGDQYNCQARGANRLAERFHTLCKQYGLEEHVPAHPRAWQPPPEQLPLF